ncbi:unnamed protein product [Rhodiola kirilowii]
MCEISTMVTGSREETETPQDSSNVLCRSASQVWACAAVRSVIRKLVTKAAPRIRTRPETTQLECSTELFLF